MMIRLCLHMGGMATQITYIPGGCLRVSLMSHRGFLLCAPMGLKVSPFSFSEVEHCTLCASPLSLAAPFHRRFSCRPCHGVRRGGLLSCHGEDCTWRSTAASSCHSVQRYYVSIQNHGCSQQPPWLGPPLQVDTCCHFS